MTSMTSEARVTATERAMLSQLVACMNEALDDALVSIRSAHEEIRANLREIDRMKAARATPRRTCK